MYIQLVLVCSIVITHNTFCCTIIESLNITFHEVDVLSTFILKSIFDWSIFYCKSPLLIYIFIRVHIEFCNLYFSFIRIPLVNFQTFILESCHCGSLLIRAADQIIVTVCQTLRSAAGRSMETHNW